MADAERTPKGKPKRRRVKARTVAFGSVVLALLFWLGDDQGWFTPGGGGPVGSGAEGSKERDPDPGRGAEPRTDAQLAMAAVGGSADAGSAQDPDRGPEGEKTTGGAGTPGGAARVSTASQIDAALGVIAELERALQEDRLADLAVMVDRLRARPAGVPPELQERFAATRARVDAALLCAPRLRDLLRQGQVLQARALLEPIRRPEAPQWLRDELDAAAAKFGWPALCGSAGVTADQGEVSGLPKHRRIRFVRDGAIATARVWTAGADKVTLLLEGEAGVRYPRYDRAAVEPVDATAEEALREGRAAAARGDVVGAVLWTAHLVERGDVAGAMRLRRLLR